MARSTHFWNKTRQQLGCLTALLILAPLPAFSEQTPLLPPPQDSATWISLKFPSSEGHAQRRDTTGARCPGLPGFVALVPDRPVSFTIDPHPTFFVYVPKVTEALQGQFTFTLDRSDYDNLGYSQTIHIPPNGGIFSFELPPEIDLDPEQSYVWYFTLSRLPNPHRNVITEISDTEEVQGGVQLVTLSPEMEAKLAQTTNPLERANFLAKQQIWYDTLEILLNLRDREPQELQDLLASVGLGEITRFGEAIEEAPLNPRKCLNVGRYQ